jgi:hypothetical protein
MVDFGCLCSIVNFKHNFSKAEINSPVEMQSIRATDSKIYDMSSCIMSTLPYRVLKELVCEIPTLPR